MVDKLQKLVNRALRIWLRECIYANVFDLHCQAKLLPLAIRRQIVLMDLMYVRLNPTDAKRKSELTRWSKRITKGPSCECSFPKSEIFRKSIAYQGAARWS